MADMSRGRCHRKGRKGRSGQTVGDLLQTHVDYGVLRLLVDNSAATHRTVLAIHHNILVCIWGKNLWQLNRRASEERTEAELRLTSVGNGFSTSFKRLPIPSLIGLPEMSKLLSRVMRWMFLMKVRGRQLSWLWLTSSDCILEMSPKLFGKWDNWL